MKINLNELLTLAKDHLSGMSGLQNPDFRLEQAEFVKKDKEWDIVVSYLVPNTNKRIGNAFSNLGGLTSDFQYHRIFKRLRVDDNKEIVGMYMFNNKE